MKEIESIKERIKEAIGRYGYLEVSQVCRSIYRCIATSLIQKAFDFYVMSV